MSFERIRLIDKINLNGNKQYIKYFDIRNFDEVQEEFNGYSVECKELKSVLSRMRADNAFDIKIDNIKIFNNRKETTKIYTIPTYKVTDTLEDGMEIVRNRIFRDRKTGETLYIKKEDIVRIARVYYVIHYSMDGKEFWFYDRQGRKSSSNSIECIFASYNQANNCIVHKLKNDKAVLIKERYISIYDIM